jgi:hypothetical protein
MNRSTRLTLTLAKETVRRLTVRSSVRAGLLTAERGSATCVITIVPTLPTRG